MLEKKKDKIQKYWNIKNLKNLPQRAALFTRGGTGMSSSDFFILLIRHTIKVELLLKKMWVKCSEINRLHVFVRRNT